MPRQSSKKRRSKKKQNTHHQNHTSKPSGRESMIQQFMRNHKVSREEAMTMVPS